METNNTSCRGYIMVKMGGVVEDNGKETGHLYIGGYIGVI